MQTLTESRVLEIAAEALLERSIGFDKETGLNARFKGSTKLREEQIKSVWTVSYLTEQNPFFDQDMHFIYIDDQNGDVLYIITPTTYIE